MPFVEHDSAHGRTFGAPPHRVDHHERVIGDDEVGTGACALRAFDEARPVMRTASINALTAPVAESRQRGAPEQGGEPSWQVAADQIAIAAIFGPAHRQLRKDRRPPAEAALDRVLEVEQAQVILATFADDDFGRLCDRIGVGARRLLIELALQGLGVRR